MTADERPPLPPATATALAAVLDDALAARLPRVRRLVVDPAVRTLAVPLTAKGSPDGLGILPRGSLLPLARHVRFFVYWKQHAQVTDYDLSVLLLDDDFLFAGQVSWTNLSEHGAVHSGDITEAPDGATEFIDLDLGRSPRATSCRRSTSTAARASTPSRRRSSASWSATPEQRGRPFEPRTVRAKSDLFGAGRVSLPVLFARSDDGRWHAKWMHLGLGAHPQFNRVEGNASSTSRLVRAIAERRYLELAYLEGLLRAGGATVREWPVELDAPVTFLGLERPDGLPAGSTVFTPANLPELLNSA